MFLRKSYQYFFSINLAQKIFWGCFLVAALSLTVAPTLIISQYTSVLQKQIEKKSFSTLSHISTLMDTTLVLENFRHIQYIASTWDETGFLSPNQANVKTHQTFKEWQYYSMIHPSLYSFCLYSLENDILLSSLEGINYDFLASGSLPYAKLLDNSKDLFQDTPLWLGEKLLYNSDITKQDTKIITFVQPCSKLFPHALQNHYLFLNYDLNYIESQINPFLSDGEYFEIENELGQILYSGKTQIHDSTPYNSFSTTSQSNQWIYRYYIPKTLWGNPLFVTLFFGVLVIVAGLFIAFFLSKFLSKKLYRPLSNLIALIRNQSNQNTLSQNDIELIQSTFRDLYSSKEILENNSSLLEYQIGQLIFKGKIKTPYEINDKLRLSPFCPESANYRLALFAFPPKTTQINPLLPYECITFIKEAFINDSSALCVPYPENCLSILVSDSNTIYSDNDFMQLKNEITSVFETQCALLLSKSRLDFPEISSTFSRLKSGLSYLSLYGYSETLTQDLIESHENSHLTLSPVFSSSIEEILKNNPDKIEEKCIEAMNYAKNRTVPYNDWTDFCHNLSYLFEIHSQQEHLYADYSQIKKEHCPSAGPQDYILFCQACRLLFCKYPVKDNHNSFSSSDFIEIIKQYICDNISPELSLEKVAEHFCLTPNYLSKIFHEYNQMTFSNYLKEAKLKKAAQLLKDKNLLVQTIAEEVGYSTPNYFNRIFKEHYGITPLQYRRKYL